jgi:hypothetical protein
MNDTNRIERELIHPTNFWAPPRREVVVYVSGSPWSMPLILGSPISFPSFLLFPLSLSFLLLWLRAKTLQSPFSAVLRDYKAKREIGTSSTPDVDDESLFSFSWDALLCGNTGFLFHDIMGLQKGWYRVTDGFFWIDLRKRGRFLFLFGGICYVNRVGLGDRLIGSHVHSWSSSSHTP